MKKTFLLLGLFGLSLAVVTSLSGGPEQVGAPSVMYSSVMHSSVDEPDEDLPEVKKKVKVKKVEEEEVAMSDTEGVGDGTEVVEEVFVEEDVCGFPDLGGEIASYKAQVITVRKKFRYQLGEEFKVKVFVKNTGNMPWFSPDSECIGANIYLGTTRDNDRESAFHYADLVRPDNSWVSSNRIRLDSWQMRIDPGEVGVFTFWSKATDTPSVHREYFAPVVDGGSFMEDAEFRVDVYSGETGETANDLRKKLLYAYKSMRVNDMRVDGERSVEVDLSDQRLFLKIDDYVIREFTVSTGKSATPTPKGNFKLFLKNEVRVGHAPPHYIMPKFQMFTAQGAGLHALPSLGNDGGVFWTEALDHIGQPMSHGCVRMLPEDANFTFEFTEIGDPINIHW